MEAAAEGYTCSRCGTGSPPTASHTEIARRDFVDVPRPSRVEQLCAGCWEVYVEEFLGRSFEAAPDPHGTGG